MFRSLEATAEERILSRCNVTLYKYISREASALHTLDLFPD